MREIWRKTAELFWERPILWLPVLCADFIGYWLREFQGVLTRELIRWLLLGPASVFDSRLVPHGSVPILELKAALIGGPFVWGGYFVSIGLYTIAFVATAVLVKSIDQSGKPDFRLAFGVVKSRIRRILRFSLRVLLFFAVAAAVWSFVLIPLAVKSLREESLNVLAVGVTILVEAITAYCVAPAALSLLTESSSQMMNRESVRWGRGFSIAGSIAGLVIAFIPVMQGQRLLNPIIVHVGPVVFNMITSLLFVLPYIPMFIALSLIAMNDAQMPEIVAVETPT